MAAIIDPQHADSARLKQLNLELGQLSHKHKACQLNSGLLGALGGVILALSALGLITLLLANDDDWARNPDSPVHAIATAQEQQSTWLAVLVAAGFLSGIGVFYKARTQCSKQRRLWKREGDLLSEMRRIRDKLYATNLPHTPHSSTDHRPAEHPAPLQPDEARGEYVGVYNPPSSHHEASGARAQNSG